MEAGLFLMPLLWTAKQVVLRPFNPIVTPDGTPYMPGLVETIFPSDDPMAAYDYDGEALIHPDRVLRGDIGELLPMDAMKM